MVIPCPIGIPAKQKQPLVWIAMDGTYNFLTDRKISVVLKFRHLLDRLPLKREYGDIRYSCFKRQGTVPQAQHTVSLELRWVKVEEELGRRKCAQKCETTSKHKRKTIHVWKKHCGLRTYSCYQQNGMMNKNHLHFHIICSRPLKQLDGQIETSQPVET